jgi:hypothetical protein
MSGLEAKSLLQQADAAGPAQDRAPNRTMATQNQRKFDQITAGMSKNKAVADTYSELFKARDRNAQSSGVLG